MRNALPKLGVCGVLAGALVILSPGCAEEEPQQVAVDATPPPPPPPPAPRVKSVAQLMQELSIDQRIALPEERAPATTEQRIAVLEFFDAFARGNNEQLGSMLSPADEQGLQTLVQSGEWGSTTDNISLIQVQTGQSPFGDACALAIFSVGTSFQPQLWYYAPDSGEHTFTAVATPPGIMDKLSGDDWIAAWHKLLEEEKELASKPDEEFKEPKLNYDDDEESSSASGGGRPGVSPGGPGKGGRRPPPRQPYRRPGSGF